LDDSSVAADLVTATGPEPILLPEGSGTVEQLARIERMFMDAEAQLNARLDEILSRGPEWFREEARLRRLLEATRAAMEDIGEALTEESLQASLGEVYAAGASEQSGVLGQAFQWSNPNFGAVDRIARDTFGDLLQATTYVEQSVKDLIRQTSKLNTSRKLTTGKTAIQAGNALAKDLRKSGIGVVTYRNGARHGVGEYSRMVLRTKTAQAYNIGAVNHGAAAGCEFFEIFDGSDCGLSYHDDPTLANGLVVPRDVAAAYVIAHPNCRRSFGARPDVTKLKGNAPEFAPSTTAAQRADQAAFEKFMRDQAKAGRRRTRRAKRTPKTVTKAKRQPRKPRAETAKPVAPPEPVDPGDAWLRSLDPEAQGLARGAIENPGLLTVDNEFGASLREIVDAAPDAGARAFIGVNYEGLDADDLLRAAERRVGEGLAMDMRALAKTSVSDLADDVNVVLAFEKKSGSLGKLVGDGNTLVDRRLWEVRAVEVIDGKVVFHLDDIARIDDVVQVERVGNFMHAKGFAPRSATHPDASIPAVRWAEGVTPSTVGKVVDVGGVTGDAFEGLVLGGDPVTVLYDEHVGQRLVDRGVAKGAEARAVKLIDDAKIMRPAIDPIDFTPNTLRSIAADAKKLGYDAVDFGRGSGVVVLHEGALAKEVAKREIRSAGLSGVQKIEAADMRIAAGDLEARERAHDLFRFTVQDDAAKWGYQSHAGKLYDAPSVDDYSGQAAGAMKQLHEETIARDIASRIDDFDGLRDWLDKEIATSYSDEFDLTQLKIRTIQNRQRVRVTGGNDSVLDRELVGKLSPEGEARVRGYSTLKEYVEADAQPRIDKLAAELKVKPGTDDYRTIARNEQVISIERIERERRFITDLDDAEIARIGWNGVDDAVLERKIAEITDGWAGTSGDSSPRAVSLQVVAAEKFGVSTDSMWLGLDTLHNSGGAIGWSGTAKSFRAAVEDEILRHGPVLEAYLDGAYKLTQKHLADAGIDEVVLVRGMRFGGAGNPPLPEALSDMLGPTPYEMKFGKPGPVPPDSSYSTRVGYGETKVVQAIGNPLQSWSTVPAVSERFANGGEFGALMQARIGAGRILSFPATGPGCTSEFEWVVIGVDDVPVTLSRIK
jgi:hypothetical protein